MHLWKELLSMKSGRSYAVNLEELFSYRSGIETGSPWKKPEGNSDTNIFMNSAQWLLSLIGWTSTQPIFVQFPSCCLGDGKDLVHLENNPIQSLLIKLQLMVFFFILSHAISISINQVKSLVYHRELTLLWFRFMSVRLHSVRVLCN